MNPLHFNRRILTWLGLCPFDAREKMWKKYFAIVYLFVCFIVEFIQLYASVKVLIASPKTDLETLLIAFVEIIALMATIYTDLVILSQRNQIIDTFPMFEKIYKKCEYAI